MKRLINYIKNKLGFCVHDYHKYSEHAIEFGMRKMLHLECSKCGKRKVEVI